MSLILAAAPHFGLNPNLVLAVAQQESSLNPKAVGPVGEIGLMQIRPRYSKFTRKDLFNPIINIVEGLRMLSFAKNNCRHQLDFTWIICYNRGVQGGSKVKDPYSNEYYQKVMRRMK
jgi:soluble lytic murein transglycosylase-like protein